MDATVRQAYVPVEQFRNGKSAATMAVARKCACLQEKAASERIDGSVNAVKVVKFVRGGVPSV